MSDWRETGEVQEEDVRPDSTDGQLTQEGRNSMRGPPDAAAPGAPPDNGDDDDDDEEDLATIHPHRNPETLGSPEVEPQTVRLGDGPAEDTEGEEEDGEEESEDQEGGIQLPEGYRPGGPEAY